MHYMFDGLCKNTLKTLGTRELCNQVKEI